MKPEFRLLLLGLIAFLTFLIVSAPANLLCSIISKQTSVECSNISGTVWHGQATLSSKPNIAIGPIEWRISVSNLLRARLAADITIHKGALSNDLTGALWLAISPTGVLRIRDATINTDAEWAFTTAAIPIVARGRIFARISHLRFRANTIPEIEATVNWRQAGVSYPQDYDLGSYRIEIRHEPTETPERVIADISDQDSMLRIKGRAQIEQDGDYQLDLNVSTDNAAPLAISRVLPVLGRPNADGSVQIRRQGKLSEFL